ncbi:hypothetical protein ACFQ08_05765 [Streptosporangium algeriense]|uniref:Polyketide cyclase / dehydrase and lipid transport n=1 Tax=Streptosporangium algeriense TaxID=1682748 RepID=A0ABW3DMV6_9ACTN
MRKVLLYEVAGVVEAPPDQVGRLILTVRPGPVGRDNAWLYSSHGGTVEPYGGGTEPYGGMVEPYGGTGKSYGAAAGPHDSVAGSHGGGEPYGGAVESRGGGGEGGLRRFTLRMPAHTMIVEVTGITLAAQGGWWYRGEHIVEPHPEGTLLTHRVFNVAGWGRWAVRPANRFFAGLGDRTRKGFAEGLQRVGLELGCGTRLLGSDR